MKISIVTPSFNSVHFIEDTILSVLDQGYSNLEYIVIDGGSTDGTTDVIKKYQHKLAYWISEPDKGMYDAINKGFSRATGDIFAWINSDDTLLPGALKTVSEAFALNHDAAWIHGRTIYTDVTGQPTQTGPLFLFHQSDLLKGYHGLCAHFVQQHCCFWRSFLWHRFGPIPTELRYAGDYWLWTQFAKASPLVSLNYPVATFRRHNGQLHKEGDKYRREVRRCYSGSFLLLLLRIFIRRISRSSDLDSRIFNHVFQTNQYCWIDPNDHYSLKQTYRARFFPKFDS